MADLHTTRNIRNLLLSGYSHYSREAERKLIQDVLLGNLSALPGSVGDYDVTLLSEYPLRSLQNNLICAVAVVCRHAADLGADDEKCFAASDTFILEVEKLKDVQDALELLKKMTLYYIGLVAEGQEKTYSLTISRAVRYIRQHLYQRLPVKEIAESVGVHPNYLSSRFREETGISLCGYIRNRKMEEAQSLLLNTGHSISEIAEMLGYSSVSHFSKSYKAVYGHLPHETLR